jgi:hypothetical protein
VGCTHGPNIDFQLFGGLSFPSIPVTPSSQMYQSLLGFVRELRDSWNQACWECSAISSSARIPWVDGMCVGEPAHLIGRMVDNQVHDKLHAMLVNFVPQTVPVLKGAVSRVRFLIVGYVIALAV